jgi:hypothetical protein
VPWVKNLLIAGKKQVPRTNPSRTLVRLSSPPDSLTTPVGGSFAFLVPEILLLNAASIARGSRGVQLEVQRCWSATTST